MSSGSKNGTNKSFFLQGSAVPSRILMLPAAYKQAVTGTLTEDAMRTYKIQILVVFLTLTLLGCGGGGDESEDGGLYLWVSVDRRALKGSVADLSGRASCPDCPPSESSSSGCPAPPWIRNPPEVPAIDPAKAISISWTNHTTGASAAAEQWMAISYSSGPYRCTLSYQRQWSASVPLAVGTNVIEVTASNVSGSSGSDMVTITRTPLTPTGVVVAPGHGQITISWSDVPDIASYNIYWSTSRTLSKDSGITIANVSSPFQHSGLSNDVTYYYLVTAVGGDTESDASEIAWATAGWSTETAAELPATTSGRRLSLAMDTMGGPHVYYGFYLYDAAADTPFYRMQHYYATRVADSWTSAYVNLPKMPSLINMDIALDLDDTVHLGYMDHLGVNFATFVDGAWTADVAYSDRERCGAALALDSTGRGHVAMMSGLAMGYANNTSGTWTPSVVDSFAVYNSCQDLDIVADEAGFAHIAFARGYSDGGLKYATNKGGLWIISVVDQVEIKELSAAVDLNGNVHIVYTSWQNGLRYAHNVLGEWTIETIESEGTPYYPSLTLDTVGTPHVSFYARKETSSNSDKYGELRYAKNSSGVWQVSVIDDIGYEEYSRDTDTAIALDSQGKVHIGYFDIHSGNLKYATNK
jgi:hypothetical protein